MREGGPDAVHVPWGRALVPAVFVERPNRFVVHAEVDGSREVAHLADPGRLTELLVPGRALGLRPESTEGGRTTRWTAVVVEAPPGAASSSTGRARPGLVGADRVREGRGAAARAWVGVNTTVANRLVARALESGALPELGPFRSVRAEVALGRSRLDFLLEDADGGRTWVEAKSVTLIEEGRGLFPDAPTARGTRHVEELTGVVEAGERGAVLFLVQRADADSVSPADSIDPAFGEALRVAAQAGVRLLARRCRVGWEGVTLGERVPVVLDR